MQVYFNVPESMNIIYALTKFTICIMDKMACPMLYTHLNTQTIKAYAVQTLSNQFNVRKK